MKEGFGAFQSLVKKCKKEDLQSYLETVRNIILDLASEEDWRGDKHEVKGKILPGLAQKNGLEPFYPIYQHGKILKKKNICLECKHPRSIQADLSATENKTQTLIT
jgi:hypothetical protein